MLNRVMLIGHLGKDPDIRRTNSGDPVASFSIATNEYWTDKATNEKRERTDWHDIVVYGAGLVDICEKYLRRGSRVYVEGKQQTRKWQDRAGNDRYRTEVVLRAYGGEIRLLDRAERAPAPDPDAYGETKPRAPATAASPIDDDIPF